MRHYKLIYLIQPGCQEKDLREIQESLNLAIQEEGGILGNSEIEGRKRLSYKIKGQDEAIFVNLDFYLKPEKIGGLENKIKSKEGILRYSLIIKREQKRKAPIRKPRKIKKEKVELSEIEEKLKEILNESR